MGAGKLGEGGGEGRGEMTLYETPCVRGAGMEKERWSDGRGCSGVLKDWVWETCMSCWVRTGRVCFKGVTRWLTCFVSVG